MPYAHWWMFSPNEWVVTLVTGYGVWPIHFNSHWWHSVPVMRSSSAEYAPRSPLVTFSSSDELFLCSTVHPIPHWWHSVPVTSFFHAVRCTLIPTGWRSVSVIGYSRAAICTLFPIGWHSVPVANSVYSAIYNLFSIGRRSVSGLRTTSAVTLKHPVSHWWTISNTVPMRRSSNTAHSRQFTLTSSPVFHWV